MTEKDTVYPVAEAMPAASEPIVMAAQAQPVPPQAEAQTSYSVQEQEGCGPFDLIRVPLAGEQLYDVHVPDGYTEGMIFQVNSTMTRPTPAISLTAYSSNDVVTPTSRTRRTTGSSK